MQSYWDKPLFLETFDPVNNNTTDNSAYAPYQLQI
ncbi:MAG: hypothetical protein ACI8YQ_004070 [Polaribacter sp.]|jgi:hypothetical protein